VSWWNPFTWFAKPGPQCPRCHGPTKRRGVICWSCSAGGVTIDGVDRGDTVVDRETRKALYRAQMKELNRG